MSTASDRRTFIHRLAAGLAATAWLGRAKPAEAATTGTGPYLGEIMLFAGSFAPRGWALCNGQLLPINVNQALFSLVGTTYGGNGVSTFALPDLRDRVPIHMGQGPGLSPRPRGERAGEAYHLLTLAELPAHSHGVRVSAATGTAVSPTGMFPAEILAGDPQYATTADVGMSPDAIAGVGGGQAHSNLQPYLGLNFCIALTGVFPSSS
jgi:microcystin-dependent protein